MQQHKAEEGDSELESGKRKPSPGPAFVVGKPQLLVEIDS